MTPVEQIKSRLSVVDVVSWYVKLLRAGSNFKAPCPFHAEKSPSFFVSPARDVWHCFGCGIGGDQFRFIMQIEGMDFREALQLLAERAGVELRPENREERSERARLFSLLEEAAQFYQTHLSGNPLVREYLTKRGVLPGTIEKFRVGYAPPETASWRAFTEFALKKGYKPEELEKAGLAIRKQTQSPNANSPASSAYYDRFRNRIMFPIMDANGRAIGFGGRIFEESQIAKREAQSGEEIALAKYINTPQTMLYDKSKVLYAFDKAKTAIRKENACILVEGYMDAIMAHQAGTENTVAVSGTALTRDQVTMIRRLCDTVITSFDTDGAGESATRRSIDLALEMGFDVKAITLSQGKDPADLVLADPDSWRRAAGETTHIITYFLEKALGRNDVRTVEGKRNVISSVLPLTARITREVEKAHWVSLIASRLSVREESVWQDLKKYAVSSQRPGPYRTERGSLPQSASKEERGRARVLEDRILGILFAHGVPVPAHITEHLFSSEHARVLFAAISKHHGTAPALAAIADEELRSYANRLIFEAEMLVPAESAGAECAVCITELERERVKEKLTQLTHDIRKAEEAGNEQQIAMLIDEFGALSKELITT